MNTAEYRQYCLEVRAKALAENMVHEEIMHILEHTAELTARWVYRELVEVFGNEGAKYFSDQISERILHGGRSP